MKSIEFCCKRKKNGNLTVVMFAKQKNGGLEINFSVWAEQCGHINNIALTSCYKHIIRSTMFFCSSLSANM